MKKIFIIGISLLLLCGCDKEKSTQNNNDKNENPKTCTEKQFNEKYKYVYDTLEECHKEGESTAFFDIVDNYDDRVFTINCDEIIDECGNTYYGVSYNIYDPENSTRDDGVVVIHY